MSEPLDLEAIRRRAQRNLEAWEQLGNPEGENGLDHVILSLLAEVSRLTAQLVEEARVHDETFRAQVRRADTAESQLAAAQQREAGLREVLESSKISHLVVDGDCWYSCPKSGECCNDAIRDGPCDCGADEHNARIEAALAPEEGVTG